MSNRITTHLCAALAVLTLALSAVGCDGTKAGNIDTTRAVLDAYGTTANTLQELVVVTCDTVARVEIQRAETREEADRAEEEIGVHCSAVYQVFDAIRSSHQAALQMVDMIEAGGAEPAELITLLLRLGNLVAEGQAAWSELRAVLRDRGHDPPDEVSGRLHRIDRWARAELARL